MMTSATLVSSRLGLRYVVFGAGNSLPTPTTVYVCMYVTKPEPSLPVGRERARLNPGPRPAWSPLFSPLLP